MRLITHKVVTSDNSPACYTGSYNDCELFITSQSDTRFTYRLMPMSKDELITYNSKKNQTHTKNNKKSRFKRS